VFTLFFLRFTLASILLFLYIFLTNRKIILNKKQILNIFVMGGILYSVFSFCYFSAIRYILASLAGIDFLYLSLYYSRYFIFFSQHEVN